MKIEISIIITTYNQPGLLDMCLASLLNQSFKNFEIVIADDGSDPKTKNVISQYLKQLKIQHEWHQDRGYRKALILNKAIKKAKAPYIVFIDGDCILHKDFILYHFKEKEPKHYLTGRRVELGPDFSSSLSSDKVKTGYLDKFNLNLLKSCIKKDSKRFHRSIPITNKLIRKLFKWNKVPNILGSNMSMYKKTLIELNGFNEDLKNYWGEDGDLFIRLRNSRYKIKSLKNLAIQYHIYHKRRNPDPKIEKWYYKAEKNNFTYRVCKNGLKKFNTVKGISEPKNKFEKRNIRLKNYLSIW